MIILQGMERSLKYICSAYFYGSSKALNVIMKNDLMDRYLGMVGIN